MGWVAMGTSSARRAEGDRSRWYDRWSESDNPVKRASRPGIDPVAYGNPLHPELGIETFSLAELRRRAPPEHLALPQRPDFHMLLLVTGGRGGHDIDFRRYDCAKGTVLHVRPGQVQRFLPSPSLAGALVLFTPDFLPPQAGPGSPSLESLLEDAVPAARIDLGSTGGRIAEAFRGLAEDYDAYDGTTVARRILQHGLQSLLLRLARLCSGGGARAATDTAQRTHRRFAREVERRFRQTRAVADYAKALGYSPRTLTRASLGAGGVTAKEWIERRVALEAKRLLAHTAQPVGAIAVDVGFSEATNFVKFFRRREGLSPLAFRARYRKR